MKRLYKIVPKSLINNYCKKKSFSDSGLTERWRGFGKITTEGLATTIMTTLESVTSRVFPRHRLLANE